VVPLAVGLVVYMAGRASGNKQTRLLGYRIWKEWELCALLFVQLHLAVTLCISLAYDGQKMVGMAFGGLVYLAIAAYLLLLFCSSKNFGEYKSYFKPGGVSQNWYVAVILLRSVMGFALGFMWEQPMCAYVVLGVAGVWMVAGAVVRPYISNVRPIVNSLFIFAALGLLAYCNESRNS
jgi:hypothetical protein